MDVYLKQAVDKAHLPNILVSNNPEGNRCPSRICRVLKPFPESRAASYVVLMPGYYRTPRNSVAVFVTDPASFFRVDPDLRATPEGDVAALAQNRIGALVTPWLANKYGWKRGD